MHQVPVLRNEIGRGGQIVVGAYHPVKQRIRGEFGKDRGDRVGPDADVGIEEKDNLSCSRFRPDVPGSGRTAPLAGGQNAGAMARGDLNGVVGRFIINHDAFKSLRLRTMQAREALLQLARGVEHRYYDGQTLRHWKYLAYAVALTWARGSLQEIGAILPQSRRIGARERRYRLASDEWSCVTTSCGRPSLG